MQKFIRSREEIKKTVIGRVKPLELEEKLLALENKIKELEKK